MDGDTPSPAPQHHEWVLRVQSGSVARLTRFPEPEASKSVRVDIETTSGKHHWDVQLSCARFSVRQHHAYALSFRARAETPRHLHVGCGRNHASWDSLGLNQSLRLTPDWKRFDTIFIATGDEDNARVHFDAGDSGGAVEVSDVTLVPWSAATIWSLRVHPGNEARLAVTPKDAQRVRVNIDETQGQEAWELQLEFAPLSTKARRAYLLEFRARADRPRQIQVRCGSEAPGGNSLLYFWASLGEEWRSFQQMFIAQADDERASVVFNLGLSDISVECSDVRVTTLAEMQTPARTSPAVLHPFEIEPSPLASYLICATHRSGSNLLCEAITSTRLGGHPSEFFYFRLMSPELPITRGATMTPPSMSLMTSMFQAATTANGVLGIKTMWESFDFAIQKLRTLARYDRCSDHEVLADVFPNLHYIHITRRDKIRQAVSWAKAIQSDQWTLREQSVSSHAADGGAGQMRNEGDADHHELEYRFDEVSECHRRLLAQEEEWESYFESFGIEPHRVVYEKLINAYEQTAIGVLNHLGLVVSREDFVKQRVAGERTLKRQKDRTNDEWAQRFRAELAERGSS